MEFFQDDVKKWALDCFGPHIDLTERQDRFLEEVFELLQASGYDKNRISALANYTWGREKGDPFQELGGVMTTLAVLASQLDLNMVDAAFSELARIKTKIDIIRQKQATKPSGSILPLQTDVFGWVYFLDGKFHFSKEHPHAEFPKASRITEATLDTVLAAWTYTNRHKRALKDLIETLPFGHTRIILSLLGQNYDKYVQAETLLSRMYSGSKIPENPGATLRQVVSRLRKLVGPNGFEIVSTRGWGELHGSSYRITAKEEK